MALDTWARWASMAFSSVTVPSTQHQAKCRGGGRSPWGQCLDDGD